MASFLISYLIADQNIYWDLGVTIDNTTPQVYQREINIDSIEIIQSYSMPENIKALHSENFIEPILYEIKNSINSNSIIKKYDELVSKFSEKEKVNFIKKAFLNKEYIKFFAFHTPAISNQELDNIYIQNLYFSKSFKKAINYIDKLESKQKTDEILWFEIKSLIKLKQLDEAKNKIDYFLEEHTSSDLLNYVIYENTHLKINNENK